jgi:hypothetical protein
MSLEGDYNKKKQVVRLAKEEAVLCGSCLKKQCEVALSKKQVVRLVEEASCQACRRTRLSGLKSELLCELHCNNKVVVGYFYWYFS